MSSAAELLESQGNYFLSGPHPIRHKKRVSRTIYWETCPECGEVCTGWEQDTREPRRQFKPCGCQVEWAS